jgi:cytochrome P450
MFVYNYWYYKKQGVAFVGPMLPIIGNFFKVCQVMQTEPTPDFVPFMPILEENYGKGGDFPEVCCFMMQSQPLIVLNSAQALTDVYVTKNKFFDKDPMSRITFGSLFGDSIVLAASDELWSKKRKVLSSAFYKDKLIKMTETIRQVVADKIKEFE